MVSERQIEDTLGSQKELHDKINSRLRWFQYGHLPEGPIRDASKRCAVMALEAVEIMHPSEELLSALDFLLSTKEALVRAVILTVEKQEENLERAKR
jgi:hypothetical protein